MPPSVSSIMDMTWPSLDRAKYEPALNFLEMPPIIPTVNSINMKTNNVNWG